MKKFFLSSFVILTFIVYTIHKQLGNSKELNVTLPNSLKTSQSEPLSITPNAKSTNTYKDGEYTGDVADAYYGNVQVKATIQGGKITDVQFLDYPHDRRTSVMINTQAMPYLKTETIQAQSGNVDIVSGATQTSRAFIESLQSALIKAQS